MSRPGTGSEGACPPKSRFSHPSILIERENERTEVKFQVAVEPTTEFTTDNSTFVTADRRLDEGAGFILG